MLIHMRTTLDINDELMRLAKERAARQGSTLRSVVEAALRSHLTTPESRPEYRLEWRTEEGKLLPGIDLNDRDSLFDRLDGRE